MECVQELASAEAGIFRDVLPVAPPETLPETLIEASIRALLTLAQSVRKLRLVVAVIARGAEERGLVVDERDVERVEAPMEQRGRHAQSLEEGAQLSCGLHQTIPLLGHVIIERRDRLPLLRNIHLVVDPILAEEDDPVVSPLIRLKRTRPSADWSAPLL